MQTGLLGRSGQLCSSRRVQASVYERLVSPCASRDFGCPQFFPVERNIVFQLLAQLRSDQTP